MTFEYAESLTQLMALSKQDVKVKKQWQTANTTIATIRQQLLDDAVLTNHFTAMAKEIALFLDGVKHYDQNTLDSLINKFSDESKQVAWFHEKIEQLSAATPRTFLGIHAMLDKNKAAMASAIRMEDLSATKNWINDLLVEKSNLKEIDEQLEKFFIYVKGSFLFKEQQWITALLKCCREAITGSDISAIYQDVSTRKHLLAAIAQIDSAMTEDYSEIYHKEGATGGVAYIMDKQRIQQHFSTLERARNLSKNDANKIMRQLKAKCDAITKIKNQDYPSIGLIDFDNGFLILLMIIVVGLLNSIIAVLGWPFIYISRVISVKKAINKSVLLW